MLREVIPDLKNYPLAQRCRAGQRARLGKRCFDLVVASCLLVVTLPLWPIVGLAIRLTTLGPVLLQQRRLGRKRQPFTCLKFRTMYDGCQEVGTHEIDKAWITPVGILLRKMRIDELPQLINVLLGTMSLVGPRPCLPNQTEVIEERVARGVFCAKPGITGPAQIDGIDMSKPVELAVRDQEYLTDWSLARDLLILARTLVTVVSGRLPD